ncbi:MAG: AI-2E family transporter [Polyangiaceae bacterium]
MSRNERWISVVLRVAPLLLFLWMVRDLLVPVALAALFALLLHPLQARMTRWWPRLAKPAPLMLTAGVIVLVVIPFALLVARVVVSVQSFLAGGLADVAERLQAFAARHFSGVAERLHLPVERLRGGAMDLAQHLAATIGNMVSGMAAGVPGLVIGLFLFVLSLFYFLRDGAAAVRWIWRLLPFAQRDTGELFESIRATVHGALVGQIATSAVQGSLTVAALYIFGVPGALLFGLIATLLSVVPLVGTTPVTIGAVIYLLSAGRVGAAIGMGIAAIVIGMSDNVVRPWVQSSGTRMHPLVTLLAIFGGIALLGWAGVFLGPVIAAMALWTVDLYAIDHDVPPRSSPERDGTPPEGADCP